MAEITTTKITNEWHYVTDGTEVRMWAPFLMGRNKMFKTFTDQEKWDSALTVTELARFIAWMEEQEGD